MALSLLSGLKGMIKVSLLANQQYSIKTMFALELQQFFDLLHTQRAEGKGRDIISKDSSLLGM